MRETIYTAGLYLRLSKEDNMKNAQSVSIDTQRKKLTDYANTNNIIIGGTYIDDGLSGVFFDRPGFEQMMADVNSGKLNCVIVKDLSRLGRNDAEANKYYEDIFLTEGIRFIAIDDNVDTLKGFEQLVPFMNLFNAMYPRDISNKTRSAYKTKAEHGEFLGSKAPYGYKKSPEDKHKLIADEESAAVVRHIFDLVLKGYGRKKISRILRKERILTPAAYARRNGCTNYNNLLDIYKDEYLWNDTCVGEMIENEVYIGNCVNHKKVKPFKSKRAYDVPKDEWIIVEGTHEPIISKEVWNEAQRLIKNRRRGTKTETVQIFSGLITCADCGRALNYSSMHDGYLCGTYRIKGKEYCTNHSIKYDEVYTAVLSDIYAKTKALELNSDILYQAALKCREQKIVAETTGLARQLEKAEKRISELDVIIKKTYENSLSGLLTAERCAILLKDYEKEQAELKEQTHAFEEKINDHKAVQTKAEDFVELIRKYIGIEKLDAAILNDLIEKILVGEKYMQDGKKTQEIDIYYKFAGRVAV